MLPLRLRVFWSVLSKLDRAPLSTLTAGQVTASRARRQRMILLPGAWLVVGRTDKRVRIEDQVITIDSGVHLPIRTYRPRTASSRTRPVILNFHGGGFVSGDAQQSQWWCSSLAAALDAVVISVEYRLAPESPFPGPPEDCYAAVLWLAAHAAELDVDLDRIAVMGDSAGGNLAAVVAILARDRSGPSIAHQVLLYPAVEMVETFPSERENEYAPVLTAADVQGFSRLYLAGGDGADIRWSPLRADHRGLPPALIQTAQHDPLRDQGTAYAQALNRAGVAVRLTNYVDAAHGYISVPGLVPAARQALAEVIAELTAAGLAHRK